MFSIRSMRQEDFGQVLEMMKVFYASPAVLHKASEDILRQDIEDCVGEMPYIEGYVFTENACDMPESGASAKSESVAGYAMVAKGYSTEYGGLCLWVEDIYMKPQYRHQGLSSLFFSYLENKYEGKAVRFRLEVEEENQAAVEAYRKNGYQVLPYLEMTKEV